MDGIHFRSILIEFPQEFRNLKRLAVELRDILFPIREGGLFTGTHPDANGVYQPMIEAFERAIAREQEKEDSRRKRT